MEVLTATTENGTVLGHYALYRTDNKGGVEATGRDLYGKDGRLVDTKFASGPTVLYGTTAGTDPAAAGATGFALGMKFLRPTEINNTETTNVSGVSSSSSDQSQEQQMQQQQKQKGGDATASPTVSPVIAPTMNPSASASTGSITTQGGAGGQGGFGYGAGGKGGQGGFGYGAGGSSFFGASATANPTIVNKPETNVGVGIGIGIGVDNKNINVNDNYNKNQTTINPQPHKKCGWC